MNQKFTYSGINNPCPICDRTKDKDCRISDSMVLCHTSIDGSITQNGWKFIKTNTDDRCGIYVIPQEKSPRPIGKTFNHTYSDRQGNQYTFNRKYLDNGTKKTTWETKLGIKESELLPYRWTEVEAAKSSQESIYLVEGELSADELVNRFGLVATNLRTIPNPETLELFRGSHLIICPDRDKKGIEKALKNYEAFKTVASSIKMMLSEPSRWDYIPANGGRDVYDWIVDGCTRENIEAAIAPFDLTQFIDKPETDQADIKSTYEQVCQDLDAAIAEKALIDAELIKTKQEYLEAKQNPLNPDLGQLTVNYDLLKTQAKIASDKVATLRSKTYGLRVDINRQAKEERQQRAIEESDPKIFDLLMEIVSELYLFKQDTEFGDTYVDVVSNEVRRTFRLRSKDFKSWLSKELYSRHTKPANGEALETCLKVCEGLSTENINSVWMRTADFEGKIYFDLCNALWQAVEISKQGWRVVNSRDLPIRFVRSLMQVELPTPSNQNDFDHSLGRLFELLSIAEESKPLVLGWLLSALVPTGDKPILVLSAPKGSGKSTIAKFLVNLIDHTKASLLPAVGDRRAMAVQAKHRWILAYDNLSHLSTEQQDAMCCASTGAGYIERQLFTDNDVTFVEYRRPQILTSVDLVPTRSDLLDRCLLVKVKPLPECDRKTNEELDQLFREIHAEVIGSLFNSLVTALNNFDKVKQPLQRMASFHKLALAANIPNFHSNYLASVSNAQESAVRANPVAEAIAELGNFSGSAQDLATKLKAISDDTKVQKLTSRTLGKLLNGTLKSDLEAIGISTDSVRLGDKSGTRQWLISKTDRQPSLMSEMSEMSEKSQNSIEINTFQSDMSSDIKPKSSDMKNLMSEKQSLMSDKRQKLEPALNKDLDDTSDISDVSDMKISHLSGKVDNNQQIFENSKAVNNEFENYEDLTDF